MSVDLTNIPADEEVVRRIGLTNPYSYGQAIQNVLDALNLFRCRAKFAEQELERANAELIEVRNSAEHNRIFGGSYGRV
jgi:hypothetical protein